MRECNYNVNNKKLEINNARIEKRRRKCKTLPISFAKLRLTLNLEWQSSGVWCVPNTRR